MEAEVIHVDESPRSSSTFLVRLWAAATVSLTSWFSSTLLKPSHLVRGGQATLDLTESKITSHCKGRNKGVCRSLTVLACSPRLLDYTNNINFQKKNRN